MTYTFNDAVAAVSNALVSNVSDGMIQKTEGASWEFYIPCKINGVGIDLTGCTVEWKVLDASTRVPFLTITGSIIAATDDYGTSSNHVIKGIVAPSATADTAGGTQTKRRCPWYCKITNGSGRVLFALDAQEHQLIINRGDE